MRSSYLKAEDASDWAEVITAANREDGFDELVKYLKMARQGEGPDDRLGARVRLREDGPGHGDGGVRERHEHSERAGGGRPPLRREELQGREGALLVDPEPREALVLPRAPRGVLRGRGGGEEGEQPEDLEGSEPG